jgi:hypothetical protein
VAWRRPILRLIAVIASVFLLLAVTPGVALACGVRYAPALPGAGGCGGRESLVSGVILGGSAALITTIVAFLKFGRGALSAQDLAQILRREVPRIAATGRPIPEGRQDIRQRLGEGRPVPLRAAGNPDSFSYNPARGEYLIRPDPDNPNSGSTPSNRAGFQAHQAMKQADIDSGLYDQVDEYLTDSDGNEILLPEYFSKGTLNPTNDTLTRCRPDAVSFSRSVIMERKPQTGFYNDGGFDDAELLNQLQRYAIAFYIKQGYLPQTIVMRLHNGVRDVEEITRNLTEVLPWLTEERLSET